MNKSSDQTVRVTESASATQRRTHDVSHTPGGFDGPMTLPRAALAQPTSTGVPLPLPELLPLLQLDRSSPGPLLALDRVRVHSTVLEDFRPLFASLEWRLAAAHWNREGVRVFADGSVPFVINNSGRLSQAVAAVAYEQCRQRAPARDFRILELGAGCGLFARYFLDALASMSTAAERDDARRVTYFVTDGAPRSVDQWAERGIFDAHRDRVVTGVCDARNPTVVRTAQGDVTPRELDLVIANYVLDVLPAGIIREVGSGCEELWVRTHLSEEALALQHGVRAADIRRWAEAAGGRDPEALLPWLSFFEFESTFRPNESVPAGPAAQALGFAGPLVRTFVNWGAFDCLDACVRLLAPDGIILVQDYGPTAKEEVPMQAASQRFGSTLALGVNFPLLEHVMAAAGLTVIAPPGDDDLPIHSRLIARRPTPAVVSAYRSHLSREAYDVLDQGTREARQHAAAGRMNEALAAYRVAVGRNLHDWCVLGEAAEFVALQLREFEAGADLAHAALTLNPWYSAWLWNVLGDALFCLERYDGAHEAYLQAARIDAHDARTNLNLAYTLEQQGRTEEALGAIARGLAHDPRTLFRDRLLEKQQKILATQSARWLGEQERITRRMSRLTQ